MGRPTGVSKTAAFIEAARFRHGQKYDYAQAAYVNSATKVEIRCLTHGPFMQTPNNHLAGKGCRRCATDAAKERHTPPKEQFVEKARAVHGDRYDYSSAQYQGAHKKLVIQCPVHGSFEQTADAHVNGAQGCPACGRKKRGDVNRGSTKRFADDAVARFGNRFDYSKAVYVDAWTPVEIVCPAHGSFQQPPARHLRIKYGCPRCALAYKTYPANRSSASRRLGQDEFLRRAAQVHGEMYDYGQVVVTDFKSKVTIVCRQHGPFEQSPTDHLSGRGCKKCSFKEMAERQRQPPSKFIERARLAHGDKYDYSLVEYTTARRPVTIVCPKHGPFEQVPDRHLKSGCRKCADEALPGAYSTKRFRDDTALAERMGTLYYVRFHSDDGESFYKIGISNGRPEKRFAGYCGSYGYRLDVLATATLPLGAAHEIETHLLVSFVADHKYLPLKRSRTGRRFGGRNECFNQVLPSNLIALIKSH